MCRDGILEKFKLHTQVYTPIHITVLWIDEIINTRDAEDIYCSDDDYRSVIVVLTIPSFPVGSKDPQKNVKNPQKARSVLKLDWAVVLEKKAQNGLFKNFRISFVPSLYFFFVKFSWSHLKKTKKLIAGPGFLSS